MPKLTTMSPARIIPVSVWAASSYPAQVTTWSWPLLTGRVGERAEAGVLAVVLVAQAG